MRNYKGYSSKDALIGNRRNRKHSAYNPDKRRRYDCPVCLANFPTDEEFKAHWKARHNTDAMRGQARRNNLHQHRIPSLVQKWVNACAKF